MAFYNVIFDRAVDHFDLLGVGSVYARSGAGSCFTLEVRPQEVSLNDELKLHLQLLTMTKSGCIFFSRCFTTLKATWRQHQSNSLFMSI